MRGDDLFSNTLAIALVLLLIAWVIQVVFFAPPPPPEHWEVPQPTRPRRSFKSTIAASVGVLILSVLAALLYSVFG